MSISSITFTSTGPVAPDEAEILAGVQADINAAFGGGVNPAVNTPQGQLATSLTAVIGNKNDEILAIINGVDPATSSGAMQDAIGRLYFMDRIAATPTVVQVVCTGLAGTVLPVASLVVDTAGVVYGSTGTATIGVGGNVTVEFEAVATGPVVCPSNSISIYKTVVGWDTAANPAPGITGRSVESRADFEYRRKNSVALNASGTNAAIYANVFAVANVSDVYVLDNPEGSNVVVDGITLIKNSVYVAAVGGLDADIAAAIWRKKSSGANYTGNTSVAVEDSGDYLPPYPTYTVKFQRPAVLPILFAVQIADSPDLPADIVALVKAAIVSAFNGGDGGARARIGASIYASRFYGPVAAVATLGIVSILIGTVTATLNSVTVGIGQAPTVAPENITVTLV